MRKFFLVIIVSVVFITSASVALAEDIVELGIAERAAGLYDWALVVGVILAMGVIVFGGMLYVTSSGNPGRMGEGKKWITAAISGLLLLFSSFLILNTINPDLTNLESIVLLVDKQIAPAEGKIIPLKGAPAYFAPADDPICYEGCISAGGGEETCEGLPACSSEMCPLLSSDLARPTVDGVWLSCRTGGGPGSICPWNEKSVQGKYCTSDHSGIDLLAPLGSPVYAIESGEVIAIVPQTTLTNACGHYLKLRGDSGTEYGYCHLAGWTEKMLQVYEGPVRVVAGEQIAFNGESGNAKAPHIHFNMFRSSCSRDTKTCEIIPGCYLGRINPGPKISSACGVSVPPAKYSGAVDSGDYTSSCPGGSLENCLDAGVPNSICIAECNE